MYPVKQSTALTVPFFVHDASGDGVTGLTNANFTKRISKNGGAFAAMTVTITEMENGWYSLPLDTGHTDTAGVLSVSLINSGGGKRINLQFRISARILDDLAFPTTSGRSIDVSATGEVESNLTQIDGTALVSATLNLTKLNIVNSAGDAIVASSTGGNGHGINASGNGTGDGAQITGGATGNGAEFIGGATSGSGIRAVATTTGEGIHARGGVSSGDALYLLPQGGNGNGLAAYGNGSGHGIRAAGGGTGVGIRAEGGGTSGSGISASATNGYGILGTGGSSGAGIGGIGPSAGIEGQGSGSGHGITATGASNGHGIFTQGAGSGEGLRSAGGATGNGAEFVGGGTSGDGLRLTVTNGVKLSAADFTGAVVADGSNTATTFKTDLAQTETDQWKHAFVRFTSGTLLGQVRRVTAFNPTTDFITVEEAFSTAPTAADAFDLVNE